MKIFILPYVINLTSSYHAGGGLVVIAQDLAAAKSLVSEDVNIQPTDEDWADADSWDIESATPRYYVFPDAGCCG